jgi:branched-chain amino acid transport system permease protein
MTADPASKAVVLTARVALASAIVLCAAGPWIFNSNQLTLLTEFFTVLVLVLVWNLLAGFADIVSVGQHAFVGVGAYAFYGLTVLAGINAFAAVPLAMLATLLLAIPYVAIVFRLRAAYLAVGTWVVAEVLMLTAGKLPGFGFGSGTSLPIPIVREFGASASSRISHFYVMAFVLALIAFGSIWLLLRSRFGLGLTAMRDNEEAAGSAGVNLTFSRAACFIWTAPILGFVGVLVTLQKLRIAPTASFSITDWTIYVIFIAVIGGVGSLEGPLVGTIVFFLLREYLANFGTWYLILLGALSIMIILTMPQGLWGLWRKKISASLLPIGHTPGARQSDRIV